MEIEFTSLEIARSKIKWIKNFLPNIPLGIIPRTLVFVHYDCQSIIAITKNKAFNGKSQHIWLRGNVVKQLFKDEIISIDYVKSKRNLVDPITKPLSKKKKKLLKHLGEWE